MHDGSLLNTSVKECTWFPPEAVPTDLVSSI